MVMALNVTASPCFSPVNVSHSECVCMISENSLTKHYLDGHRPYNTDCPWCVQAGMRHRKAIRVAHSDRLNNTGFSISVDLTGPHEPDVDGNTFALVAVEIASSKGGVYLQTDKTAASCLESIKQFESDLK